MLKGCNKNPIKFKCFLLFKYISQIICDIDVYFFAIVGDIVMSI